MNVLKTVPPAHTTAQTQLEVSTVAVEQDMNSTAIVTHAKVSVKFS